MSGGLFEDEEENEEDEDQDGDMISANPPVRRENQKTTAQRNKEKRVKEHVSIYFSRGQHLSVYSLL